MRVVKKGNSVTAWPREWEVPCCKSILEIYPSDIKTDKDYTGDFNGYYLDCPVCGGQPDVPMEVKQEGDRWNRNNEEAVGG